MPGRVRNLRAEVLGSDSIRVNWDAPHSATSEKALLPTRYKLYYIRTNISAADDEKETQVLLSAVKTSYTLHSMVRDSWYSIRVEAENQNGTGPSTEVLNVKTLSDAPTAPPQQVRAESNGPRSIQVTWLPPPREHQNGLITGYRIRYKTKRKGRGGNNVLTVDGNAGSHIIDGLEGGSHYTVRIAAINQVWAILPRL